MGCVAAMGCAIAVDAQGVIVWPAIDIAAGHRAIWVIFWIEGRVNSGRLRHENYQSQPTQPKAERSKQNKQSSIARP